MTGSVFLGVAVLVGVVLYLVLRRRGTRQGEAPVTAPAASDKGMGRSAEASTDFHPVTKTSLPVRPAFRPDDSGSSHPAYPVAPAKYAGKVPVRPGSSSRHEVATPVSRRDVNPVLEARRAADAPPPTEPWYPEAPASYTEGEEPGDGSVLPGAAPKDGRSGV